MKLKHLGYQAPGGIIKQKCVTSIQSSETCPQHKTEPYSMSSSCLALSVFLNPIMWIPFWFSSLFYLTTGIAPSITVIVSEIYHIDIFPLY